MPSRYAVTIHGCKGDTKVSVELTDEQAAVVRHVAYLTQQESKSDCQPTVSIAEVKTLRPKKGLRAFMDVERPPSAAT